MMRKSILFALLIAWAATAWATPALKVWRTHLQSDGTQLTLMQCGDEFFHYFLTTDGQAVVKEEQSYYYASPAGTTLVNSGLLAHEPSQRTAEEQAALSMLGSADQPAIRRIADNSRAQAGPRRIGSPKTYTGSKKGLVLLVCFDDLDFTIEDPKGTITAMLNQEGYSNSLGARGSVHDYFNHMSNGTFDLTFDIVGPYKAPKSSTYYGENVEKGRDKHSRVVELLKFALESADEEVNYRDYDWDGDGEVDQVYMLYAGLGEASGGEDWTIWPHESQIGTYPFSYRLDGIILNTYACGEELYFNGQLSGLGTFCHEFSHCLGLPDFYDSATSEKHGMGSFDVMCDGCYNNNGWLPAAYTAYERNFCGWLEYKELTEPCKVSKMLPLESGGDAYIIRNPAFSDEYYILEQRNKNVRWDRGLGGRGMLIYHVNYLKSRWTNNTVNATGYDNQCMVVVPADNSLSYNDQAEDLFPYTSTLPIKTYNEFSDNTSPADILYNKNTDGTKLLHIKLSNIKYTNSSKSVSFTFNDGTTEYGVDGIDNINSGNNRQVKAGVYTTNGTLVKTTDNPQQEQLPKGLYIVKPHNGEAYKMVVR